jgi:predicted DNA-binding transcriptional regulator AlpA
VTKEKTPMPHPVQRVLRTALAAHYLGLRPTSLEKLRLTGGGPRYIKLGVRAVGYDLADLDRWLEARKVASTSEVR